jgi:hypothetical protein
MSGESEVRQASPWNEAHVWERDPKKQTLVQGSIERPWVVSKLLGEIC